MHCKSLWIKASAKCINVNVMLFTKFKPDENFLEEACADIWKKKRERLSLSVLFTFSAKGE